MTTPPFPGRRTPARRSLKDAPERGWGPGAPTNRLADMRRVRVGRVSVWVHEIVAPIVDHLLRLTDERYDLEEIADEGGYVNRMMKTASGRTTNTPSNHSWGLAVDINWQRNPMSTRKLVTDIPAAVVQAWEEWGFNWGGRWPGNGGTLFDPMHFEFARSVPEGIDIARRLLDGTTRRAAFTRGAPRAFDHPLPEEAEMNLFRGNGPGTRDPNIVRGNGFAVVELVEGKLRHVKGKEFRLLEARGIKPTIVEQEWLDEIPLIG